MELRLIILFFHLFCDFVNELERSCFHRLGLDNSLVQVLEDPFLFVNVHSVQFDLISAKLVVSNGKYVILSW